MSRTVFCLRLQQSLAGLDFPPYPGELGQKIFNSISQEAWSEWLKRQTMLINEYRLSLLDQAAKEFLREAMISFLFEGKAVMPEA